jgi:hypothetical protein
LVDDYDRGIFWALLMGLTWIPINTGTKEDFESVTDHTGNLSLVRLTDSMTQFSIIVLL